jgi:preprotein translocase subunit SecF
MFDFVRHRYAFFAVSALLILPGLISFLLPGGLRPGIDFTSGSIMTVRFERSVDQAALRAAYAEIGQTDAIVQRSDENTFIIRTRTLEEPRPETAAGESVSARQRLENMLREKFGPITVLSFDQVSPIVAEEIVRNAILAVLAACVGILAYLAWAFRHVRSPWKYGACAVAALVHDALIVLGVFSILGRVFNIELDALFITAILTVIGFSVHDTIVVFDRIRENLIRHQGEPFEDVVNYSLTQTLGRSLTTSITVLLTLLTLLLFGGSTIRNFVLALMIGIASGTYSSIFNASMLLYAWEAAEMRQRLGRAPQVALQRA